MGDGGEADLTGTVVGGKYHVDELVGRGGMGAVYRATNRAIGKRVALKFLTGREVDAEAVGRFQREAQAASAVESAHIVEIFDSGRTDGGIPYLVMEYLRGEDLRGRMKREGQLSVAMAVHVTAQIARALARAHGAGIIHRDLKPENIFLCERDDDPVFVKILDFGISKFERPGQKLETLTREGTVLGTPYYMSPEQAQAFELDGRSDLFAVGSMLYEMLAGEPPFTASTYEAVLVRICTKDADDIRQHRPEVPPALAEVVAQLLEREPDARYASARDLYVALSKAAPGLVGSHAPSLAERPPSSPSRASSGDDPDALARTAPGPARKAVRRVPLMVGLGLILVGAFAATLAATGTFAGPRPRAAATAPAATSAGPPVPEASAAPTTAAAASLEAPVASAEAMASASPGPEPSPLPAAAPTPAVAPAPAARRPPPRSPGPSPIARPAPKPPGPGVAGGLELATSPE